MPRFRRETSQSRESRTLKDQTREFYMVSLQTEDAYIHTAVFYQQALVFI